MSKNLVGKVVGSKLIIGTKKPKSFETGSQFSTTNEKLFNSLVKSKRIVPVIEEAKKSEK